MRELLQCGCDCNLGPVEKKVVELMRLHTPPYEILRVLAAAQDATNAEVKRLEQLILTVKENGEEVLVPKRLSDLDGYNKLNSDYLSIISRLDDKLDVDKLPQASVDVGLATKHDVTELEKKADSEMKVIDGKLELKLDAASLDAKVGELGYMKETQVDQKIDDVKPTPLTKQDIITALGYEPASKVLS